MGHVYEVRRSACANICTGRPSTASLHCHSLACGESQLRRMFPTMQLKRFRFHSLFMQVPLDFLMLYSRFIPILKLGNSELFSFR